MTLRLEFHLFSFHSFAIISGTDARPNLGWIIQYLKGDKISDFNKNILYEKVNKMRVSNHIAYTIELTIDKRYFS